MKAAEFTVAIEAVTEGELAVPLGIRFGFLQDTAGGGECTHEATFGHSRGCTLLQQEFSSWVIGICSFFRLIRWKPDTDLGGTVWCRAVRGRESRPS